MTSKIENRAIRVSFVNAISTVLSILFQFISVPICLKYWGQEKYGNWLVIMSAYTLLKSLDGGYVTYVGNKVNILYHQDRQILQKHLSSAIAGTSAIGIIQMIFAMATLFSDVFAQYIGLGVDKMSGYEGRIGTVIMVVCWVFTGSYFGVLHRLMIPAGMMYQSAWWSMAFQASNFFAIIIAAFLELNLLNTCLLFGLIQISLYISSVIYIRDRLPEYFPWYKGYDFRIGLNDLLKSIPLSVCNIIIQVTSSGIILLIASLAGAMSLPVFTTSRTLANLWTNVTNITTAPLLPDVIRYHVNKEINKLTIMFEVYWAIVSPIINWGVLLSYFLLPTLYSWWTGHIVVLNEPLLCFLLASVVVANLGALMAIHLNGINSLGVMLYFSIIRGALIFIGSWLGYEKYGIAIFGFFIFFSEVIIFIIMAYIFMEKEIIQKGFSPPLKSFIMAIIAASSTIFFLISRALDWMPLLTGISLAIILLLIATIYSWYSLENSVKTRIIKIFTKIQN